MKYEPTVSGLYVSEFYVDHLYYVFAYGEILGSCGRCRAQSAEVGPGRGR